MRALYFAKILPFALIVSAILVACEDTTGRVTYPEAKQAPPDGVDVALRAPSQAPPNPGVLPFATTVR